MIKLSEHLVAPIVLQVGMTKDFLQNLDRSSLISSQGLVQIKQNLMDR